MNTTIEFLRGMFSEKLIFSFCLSFLCIQDLKDLDLIIIKKKDFWVSQLKFSHNYEILSTQFKWFNLILGNYMDNCLEKMLQKQRTSDVVVAELPHKDRESTVFKISQIPIAEKLEKFMEDVR